jgi:hypothetical protein
MLSTMSARAVVAGLLVTVAVVAFAGPASADGGIGTVNCAQDPDAPECVVQVEVPEAPGTAARQGTAACHDPAGHAVPCRVDGVGWLADDGCYYQPAAGTDLAAAIAWGGTPTPPALWYVGACGYPPVAGLTKFRVFGTAPGLAQLADRAVDALRLTAPPIRINPPPPAGRPGPVVQIAFVASWVWLDAATWTSHTATASVPGLSVTATATPVRLTLSTEDGDPVVCKGAGTPWTPQADPEAASPTCGHTYTRQGRYTLTATVTWNVTWVGGAESGNVPALTTVSTLPVDVVEPQALNTR